MKALILIFITISLIAQLHFKIDFDKRLTRIEGQLQSQSDILENIQMHASFI